MPAVEAGKGKVGDWLLQLTDQMLNISAKDRPQNAEVVLAAIKNKSTVSVVSQPEDEPKTRVVRSDERFDKKSKPQPEHTTNGAHGTPYGKIAAVIAVLGIIVGGGWWFSQSDSADVGANLFAQNGESNAANKQSKSLAKGNAILYVDSTPDGAEIYLDNILLGQTPFKNQQLPKGKHELKLTHKDAEDAIDTVQLADNEITKKQYALKSASGNVSVFSTPEGANIAIDGKDTGKKTPATIKSIAVGEHQLELRLDRYYPKQATISVLKGKTVREDLTLEGGHLVKYKSEWLEPDEKERRVAEVKRVVEQREAEAERKAKEAEKARQIAEVEKKAEEERRLLVDELLKSKAVYVTAKNTEACPLSTTVAQCTDRARVNVEKKASQQGAQMLVESVASIKKLNLTKAQVKARLSVRLSNTQVIKNSYDLTREKNAWKVDYEIKTLATPVISDAKENINSARLAVSGDGDIQAGKAKYAVCAGCHGRSGVLAVPSYPSLTGRSYQYIQAALTEFKSGKRKSPTMQAMTSPLSTDDINNLSKFISTEL